MKSSDGISDNPTLQAARNVSEGASSTTGSIRLTAAGREWAFTPRAGDALGGAAGIIVFTVAVGQTLKTGTTEVNYKGAGLFRVTRHGRTIKVALIEREA